MPGAYIPVLGNGITYAYLEKQIKDNPTPEPIIYAKLLKCFAESRGEEFYDGKKYPLLLTNLMNTVQI